MYIKTNLIMAATLLSFVITVGQESQGMTQAERVVIDNPEVITLELTPMTRRPAAGDEKLSGPFKPGSNIMFDLMGTNTTILPLIVHGWDTYIQNRLLLFRDGQEVPYRNGLDEILKSKDKEPMEVTHLRITRLPPGKPTAIEKIELNTWYEPLAVGHYQLSLKHRFAQGRKWVESTSVTFEVEPDAN
jgi:hypothetical protein